MTPPANKEGPAVLWSMLKGKNVKTYDGKELGEIKEITDNFLRLQKGTISKKKYRELVAAKVRLDALSNMRKPRGKVQHVSFADLRGALRGVKEFKGKTSV